jgi:hypothetical protein
MSSGQREQGRMRLGDDDMLPRSADGSLDNSARPVFPDGRCTRGSTLCTAASWKCAWAQRVGEPCQRPLLTPAFRTIH